MGFDFTPPVDLSGSQLITYALIDLLLIILLARVLGTLFSRWNQPRVVGEILAGLLLGPTLLGDSLSLFITPADVRPILSIIATVGLIFFMFLAGAEFDLDMVSGRWGQASILAVCAVLIPALSGFPLAQWLNSPAYFGAASETPLPFALLIGAALSVTAFPVMAHILMERNALNSPVGAVCVAAAAIITVLMFLYIAFAKAVVAGDGLGSFVMKLIGLIVFLVVSITVVRPWLGRFLTEQFVDERFTPNCTAVVIGGMLAFGVIAHLLDVNSLVGGFLWGIMLPPSIELRRNIIAKFHDVTFILLVPVFFALAGFSADLTLLSVGAIPAVVLLTVAAVGTKMLAAVPARAFGLDWNKIGTVGALFNTRGFLVLVVGLIGLDLQIMTPLVFTMLVVVALVTNLMTMPLLNWFAD